MQIVISRIVHLAVFYGLFQRQILLCRGSNCIYFIAGYRDMAAHRVFGEGPRGPSNFMCTVCRKSFKEPKILNCYHIFCMDCLQKHVKTYCRNGLFPCPICKVLIPLPVWGGLDAFETVKTPNYGLQSRR